MAIALEQTVTGLDAGSSITLTSWTPAANELVLLFIAQRNEALVPSVSGNGLTWISVANVDNTQGQNGVAIYRAMGASPSTGSIVVTNVSGFDVAVACRFSGVDIGGTNGSAAVEASGTAAGPAVDDDDAQVDVTTVTDNAWALAVFTHRSATFTTPGDQTTVSINNTNGSAGNTTTCSVVRKTITPAGSATLGGANSLSAATDWCAAAVSVKPAAANLTVTPDAAQAAGSAVAPTTVLGSTSTAPSAAGAASAATVGAVVQGSLTLSPEAASAASSAPNPGVMAGDDLTVVPAAASAASSATHAATIQGSIAITPPVPEAGVNALIGNIINLVLLTGLTAAAASSARLGSVDTSATTVFLTVPRRRLSLTLRSN